jgi:uncharacterized protein (TIGR00725 family)
MKIKVGIMGSAEAKRAGELHATAIGLGQAVAAREAILLTGATTGSVYAAGKAARDAGALHVGISPAHNVAEHIEEYGLPTDACDAIIYTGFGLKGRNVVLVRSCDVVLIFGGGMGSLNEFTIAYDEGKIIGCLTGGDGIADQIERLIAVVNKPSKARIFYDKDPQTLIDRCLAVREADDRK